MWIGSKASGEYLALSLVKLLGQIDAMAPHRDKSNDGSIGDAAHQATNSDHNPDSNGVVRAMDITHDPSGGFDSYAFANHLLATKDPRVRYVISNGRIAGTAEFVKANPHYGCPGPWQWGKYDGKNKHDHHVHISASAEPKLYDDTKDWNVVFAPLPDTPPTPKRDPVLKIGSTGTDVVMLQTFLGGLVIDGQFGTKTDAAVRQIQLTHGLVVDGIVGPATWAALKGPPLERKVRFSATGKMSVFGGPKDTGMGTDEGLALFASAEQMRQHGLGDWLLSPSAAGAPGLGRRLMTSRFYLACRWNVDDYALLRDSVAHVSANGKTMEARPVDWGPNARTGRVADLSPGLAAALGLETDDECSVVVYEDGK